MCFMGFIAVYYWLSIGLIVVLVFSGEFLRRRSLPLLFWTVVIVCLPVFSNGGGDAGFEFWILSLFCLPHLALIQMFCVLFWLSFVFQKPCERPSMPDETAKETEPLRGPREN